MAPSLISGSGVRTADETARAALAVADELRARGVRRRDRVLFKADNSTGFVYVLLALMHLDVSVVLLDHQLTDADTDLAARATKADWAVVDREPVPAGVRFVTVAELSEVDAVDASVPGRLSFAAWRRREDAVVLLSSGSTGQRKGVVRSGESFLGNLERTISRIDYRVDDVLMPLLPFSHQYGLSVVLLAALGGCALVVTPHNRLDLALQKAVEAGVTVVDATPATYRSMINIVGMRSVLLSGLRSVRMWCSGGAPLDAAFATRFQELMGLPLLDGYGSTEAGNIAVATVDEPHGSGRPLDGIEVTITDARGVPLAAGDVGEIWVDSPDLMHGYLDEGGAVVRTPRGRYRTGDVGYLDEHGAVHVVGRQSAVHRFGHTLYPDVLEHKAQACGKQVKVVALDDERRGCELVFLVEDAEMADHLYWFGRLREFLAGFELPNRVVVLPSFPLTSNGKLDLGELRGVALAASTNGRGRVERRVS